MSKMFWQTLSPSRYRLQSWVRLRALQIVCESLWFIPYSLMAKDHDLRKNPTCVLWQPMHFFENTSYIFFLVKISTTYKVQRPWSFLSLAPACLSTPLHFVLWLNPTLQPTRSTTCPLNMPGMVIPPGPIPSIHQRPSQCSFHPPVASMSTFYGIII